MLTHFAPDATPDDVSDNNRLTEFDYTVRADGKRTGVTETFWLDTENDPNTAAVPQVNQIGWTYDEIGRLADEVFNQFDDSFDQTASYVYNLTGNRRSLTTDRRRGR